MSKTIIKTNELLLTENQQPIPEQELILYVLNEHNQYITKEFIETVLQKYGVKHKIKNLALFQRAFTHTSYIIRDLKNDRLEKIIRDKNLQKIPEKLIKKAIPLQKKSYETLEFRGDSIIHDVLGNYLCDRYEEDQDEGFMTKLRTKIEQSSTLAKFSIVMGFQNYVLIGRNLEQMGDRESHTSILEDAFEAFIGALKIETNYETCEKLLISLIESELDFSELIHVDTNYKDQLLKFMHMTKQPDAEYVSKGTKEDPHTKKKIFVMGVKGFMMNAKGEQEWDIVAYGTGSSKKQAEQMAAMNALIAYGVIKEDTNDDDEYEEICDVNAYK